MTQQDLPKVVLIGTCAKNEQDIRFYLGTGKNALMQVTHGFGSFSAGISHLACKERAVPHIIYIENSTCMADRDIVQGCRTLADQLVSRSVGQPTPVFIFEEDVAKIVERIFEDKGLLALNCGIYDAETVKNAMAVAEAAQ